MEEKREGRGKEGRGRGEGRKERRRKGRGSFWFTGGHDDRKLRQLVALFPSLVRKQRETKLVLCSEIPHLRHSDPKHYQAENQD